MLTASNTTQRVLLQGLSLREVSMGVLKDANRRFKARSASSRVELDSRQKPKPEAQRGENCGPPSGRLTPANSG